MTLLAACGLVATAAPARASTLKPTPSPHAVAWLGDPPACPAADVVDGRQSAAVARDLLSGKLSSPALDDADAEDPDSFDARAFMAWLALARVTIDPATVITVCDPALAAIGRPAASITGEARDVPQAEQIASGLRSRGGVFGRASAAAAIGDRFVLPQVGAGALIDLAVDSTSGTATARIGPFGAPPATVRIAGTPGAPEAVVEHTDGSTTTHAITPPPAVATSVAGRPGREHVALTVRTAPGAFVEAKEQPPESSDAIDRFGDFGPGELVVAGPDGAATLRVGPLNRASLPVGVSITDPLRRSITQWVCTPQWRGRSMRAVRCTDTTLEAPAPTPDGLVTRLRAGRARLAAPKPSLEAMPSSGPVAVSASAKAALAPVRFTPMLRARGGAALDLLYELGETDPFLADVTGDGWPETTIGDGLMVEPALLVSRPGRRWSRVRLRADFPSAPDLAPTGDFDGDGIGDLWAAGLVADGRGIPGAASWSAKPPRRLDLRTTTAGARDLLTGGEQPPTLLPDSTGDGRPELAFALSSSGTATYSSAVIPLGQRLTMPTPMDVAPAAAWNNLASMEGGSHLGIAEGEPAELLTPQGLIALVVTYDAAANRSRPALMRLTPDGTAASVLPSFRPEGTTALRGYDPASGHLLLTIAGEACTRAAGCVNRVLRIDADGRTVASIATRGGAAPVAAAFLPDGPDADTHAEVVFREEEPSSRRRHAGPGFGGTIGLWTSGVPSPVWRELPVLSIRSEAIQARGTLMAETSPQGQHHVASWSVRGSGRRRSAALLLLGTPR